MRCLSLVPGHLSRGSRAPEEEPCLAAEARNSYRKVQTLTVRSRQHLEQVEELFKLPTSASTNVAHAHHLRIHSLNVAVLILLNRVLYAIDATASSDLCYEADKLAEETILLAQNAGRYAPLGSSYVAFCLCAAWMGFTERKSRAAVESSLLSYYSHSETDMIIDVLRNKMKELAMLRKVRTFSPSPARSLGWSKLEQQMYATFDHNDTLLAQ